MRSIAIINQKGGVGKTTTTANLAAALAARGKRVLMIDLDPQAHLTVNFGREPSDETGGIYPVLTNSAPMRESMVPAAENLLLVPSHIDLAAAELELVSVVGREVILRDALDPIRDQFDFIFVDCPPSLGILTINALVAVDEVFIPLQPHFLALQGLGKLLDQTIRLVARRINPELRVTGVVFTMYEGGTRLAGEIVDDVRQFFQTSRDTDCPWSQTRVFETVIRRNIKLAEAPSHALTIFDYAPRSNGAADYTRLAREVLGEMEAAETADDETQDDADAVRGVPRPAGAEESPDRVVAEVAAGVEAAKPDAPQEVAVEAEAASQDARPSEDALEDEPETVATLKMPEPQTVAPDRDEPDGIANIA